MRRAFLAVLSAVLLSCPVAADAQGGRETLGYGRIFNNDFLGDNEDRWRTGSNAVSWVRSYGWEGALPDRIGDILEFRLRTEIIAPDNIVTAAPGDRRYVGALSFGAHTHFQYGGTEFSLGGDVVATGPQTGLGDLQTWAHEVFGAPVPGVLGNQIPNGFHPTGLVELGRPLEFGDTISIRPFIEAQAGVESFLRVGGDIAIGRLGRDELMLRDVVTGQRYRVNRGAGAGFTAVLGGDIAYVDSSVYLPSSSGYQLTDTRSRLRAGLHWQGKRSSVFYGVTWLGKEFRAQPEGQLVGSVRLKIRF